MSDISFFTRRLPWRTPEDDIFGRGWRIRVCAEPNCKKVILANDFIHSFRTQFFREGSCVLYLNVAVMTHLPTRSNVHDRVVFDYNKVDFL